MLFSKRAPDVLLDRCTSIRQEGAVGSITDEDRRSILVSIERLSYAYRTLGQAYRPLSQAELAGLTSEPEEKGAADPQEAKHPLPADLVVDHADDLEAGLTGPGMVGIIDPPRTEVRDAVDQVHKAGIHTVMSPTWTSSGPAKRPAWVMT